MRSIEEILSEKFGCDQFIAYEHTSGHWQEINSSKICGCIYCQNIYPPSRIEKWTDDGKTACCPECGLANVVIGSSSGMPVEKKEFLSLVGAHWL